MVLIDPGLFEIILQNLITNGIKYSKENEGVVQVNLKNDEKNLILTVKDNGYGIPAAQQKRVFEKLFRADNIRTLDTQGTGLGLYIVKSILDAVNGTVSFISKEGKGTEFTVTLPLSGMKEREGAKMLTTNVSENE